MTLPTFLVEDNKTIRDNLIPALEDLVGARIVGCAEGENEAALWLASHAGDWQLVVVDVFLKQGSGLGVLRTCKQRSAKQRAVVLSNYVNPDIRARCEALGADAVFDKSRELEAFFDYCNDTSRNAT
ncbi:Response regulator of citrate/malate metabolism [Variovorax sp. PBS-H4]|uniref:response regulator n=1 Tax=Variovorax sp. PBS-H4 TaxID=434008 RepID=UPI001316BF9D|nr:response regulator [Variovorax sp. PBS-H4]VTU34692.1 Response regulator of citrate/malate metabolism [Variovorax sp. PBS-H4]